MQILLRPLDATTLPLTLYQRERDLLARRLRLRRRNRPRRLALRLWRLLLRYFVRFPIGKHRVSNST